MEVERSLHVCFWKKFTNAPELYNKDIYDATTTQYCDVLQLNGIYIEHNKVHDNYVIRFFINRSNKTFTLSHLQFRFDTDKTLESFINRHNIVPSFNLSMHRCAFSLYLY